MIAAARVVLLAALIGGVGASPAWAAGFKVDAAQSTLVVQLFKDGLAAGLGHDHVVRARVFSGTVTHDPRDPGASSIRVDVEVASLVADEPEIRRKLGLTGTLSASDRSEIDASMKADGQLAAARFPSIRFASSAITKQPDGRYAVRGALTIRGVTNELMFPADVRLENGTLRARAQVRFKQSSFGYRPYSAFLGAIKNRDEVVLHVDLVAEPGP